MNSPIRKLTSLGTIANVTLLGIAGTFAVLASCSYWYSSRGASSPSVLAAQTPRAVRAKLISAGLAPDVLAASGLTTQQVSAVAAAGREYVSDHFADLEAADEAFATASGDVVRLERLAQQGKATEQDVASLAAARTSLASATAARSAGLAGVFDAATESLGTDQRALVQRFHANRDRAVPLKYRGTDRTEEQWVSLRDAVSSQAIAARRGEDLDAGSAQILADANTAETVRAAAAEAGLADARAAWQTAATPTP